MHIIEKILDTWGLHKTASSTLFDTRNLTHPFRDWYLILGGASVLLALLIAGSVYVFFRSNNPISQDTQDTDEASRNTLDSNLLKDTLLFFEGEEKEFTKLRSDTSAIPRPY